jgi:hypothetical protein
MPAADLPPLDELQEIARKLCRFASLLTGTTPPQGHSAPELRQFAREQLGLLPAHWHPIHDAILMCAEELLDIDVRHKRIDLERQMRRLDSRGERISDDLCNAWKDSLDYPFEYRDPRVLAFRAPVKIRLAKALAEAGSPPFVIAKVTEPLLERSKTFARERARQSTPRVRAKSRAFSQARGTALRRLRSLAADRFVVLAPEAEIPAILREWAHSNSYRALATKKELRLFAAPRPDGEVTLTVEWLPDVATGSETSA